MSLIIQEMKIVEKTSKSTKLSVQQTTNSQQPTKSAANQHRGHEVICNALLAKRWIFLILKQKQVISYFGANL